MSNLFSDAGAHAALDAVFPSSGTFLALFTAAPSNTGGGTEVSTSGTAYARQANSFAAAAARLKTSNATVTFPVATASFGTVTHWGIFSAATAGTMYAWGSFTSSQTVNTGNQLTVPSGDIDLTMAST